VDIPPLLEFIPAVSPEFLSPAHQADWCEQIEACLHGGVRGLNSKPIRHHKTQTTIHGIAWLLCKDPTFRIIYMVADHDVANDRANVIRQICQSAAHHYDVSIGPEKGQNVKTNWTNAHGGGVQVMSAAQSRLGADVDVLIFDDPLSEHDADDLAVRDAVDRSIVHYTARAGRTGRRGSVLGVMSRWHPDDPIGRRLERVAEPWDYKHSAAIVTNDNGEEIAFAPHVMDLAELRRRRAELKEADPTERLWHSQFQNDPQPDGADYFGEATWYDELPTFGFRVAHGVDFAFTEGAGSDFFAAVSGRIYGHKLYVVDVQRHKLDATLLESTCRRVIATHGESPLWSYQSGPEIGTSRMLIQRGIPIGIMRAKYNKLVRAQKTIKRWNDGEILVPRSAPWARGFVARVRLFRGHEKDKDDETDALVSLCDAKLSGGSVGAIPMPAGARRPYPGMLG
jgi:predicted phage terminase large subunit-like protein